MSKILLILFGILLAGTLSAKTLPKINVPVQGNSFIIYPGTSPISFSAQILSWEDWAAFSNTPQKFYSFCNTIELSQIESASLPVNFDYKLVVSGTLVTYSIGSPFLAANAVTTPVTLEINYDPAAQKTCKQLDYFSYSNAYNSEFKIETVSLTSQSTSIASANLYAEVSKIVELNFGTQGTNFIAPTFNTVPTLHGSCVDEITNELVINWTPVDFAQEYELEITFRDNYSNNISIPLPASSIAYNFKDNATRIVTPQNFYRIPMVYEQGYLLYRIRAIGMGGQNWDKRIPCKWSGSDLGTVDAFPDRYGPFPAHVSDRMNWQLSTTYSDEGKRKDVAQYYDGLNMNRQTVTGVIQLRNDFTQNVLENNDPNISDQQETNLTARMVRPISNGNNSGLNAPAIASIAQMGNAKSLEKQDGLSILPVPFIPLVCSFYGREKVKEIIAQEVIPDFNGRPALQILPVPTATHKITYIRKLNRNQNQQSYTWKDFDLLADCNLISHPLSKAASFGALGAAAYYGDTNPNKIGYNAFIPDSKGFPFSRVQYTPDNTGRTYRQSGVGDLFQLEQGHETKFYYAKPNQVELNRMFGNEVGYAIRYQKNMIIDPNGQISVSYLNPEGKTIATALAGLRPESLTDLDNENYHPEEITVDLMAGNTPDTLEHSLTINEQFTVAQKSTYTFKYSINGDSLTYSSCLNNNICLDCIYDLDIYLIANEDCNRVQLFNYSGTFGDLVKGTGAIRTDLTCIGAEGSDPTDIARPNDFPSSYPLDLPIGSYTLVKKLKVNKFAAEAYANLAFKDTCKSVLAGFINKERAKIDTSGCFQSCKNCMETNLANPTNCNELCPPDLNECQRARSMMLSDVSPHGQYAQYNVTSDGYDASQYPLSIFNPTHLPISNWITLGLKMTADSIPITTLKQLIENWDASKFPNKFLPFHPEYCMLQWCDNKNTGADFDLKLNQINNYSEAFDSLLLDASSNINAYKQLISKDPFFINGGGSNQADAFGQLLDNPNYPCIPNSNGVSVLEMAIDAAYCQSQQSFLNLISNIQTATVISPDLTNPNLPPCSVPAGYHSSHLFGSETATKDLEWRNLRSLYLTYKEKYLYEDRKKYSKENHCFNGCIGTENFFFFPSNITETIPPYANYSGDSFSIEGFVPVNDNDPCGTTAELFENKVKRFTNRYDAFSHTNVNLHNINLYECLTSGLMADLNSQMKGLVGEYVCDTCLNSSTAIRKDSCWVDHLTILLRQYLPSVTVSSPVLLSGSQIATKFRKLPPAIASYSIYQIKLEYLSATNKYCISLSSNSDAQCRILFAANLDGNNLKSINAISQVQFVNTHSISFTLYFSDGTSSIIQATTECPLQACAPSGLSKPCDTCIGLNPMTTDLFAFLKQLKKVNFPQQGTYLPREQGDNFQHLLGNTSPLQYTMDQNSCKLTLSAGISSPEVDNSTRFNEVNKTLQKGKTSNPKQLTKKCFIYFDNCDWLNGANALFSIQPYLPSGQSNVPTNQFILKYIRFSGEKTDTFTVHGTSSCFPVNNCHEPYFCNKDSLFPKLPPGTFSACVQAQVLTATFMAHSHYKSWLDSMKNDLLKKYYAKCMKIDEDLGYTYTDNQFHYTLYYYDQAGNLVRTVPPAGVWLLPASSSQTIDTKRNNPVVNGASVEPTVPDHTYITNYAYNSLNQLRWQVTPDAGLTTFYYDKLGRIVASQNAKQFNDSYSYTYYDLLGRIVESGKLDFKVEDMADRVKDYKNWKAFLANKPKMEIVYTQYDVPFKDEVSLKFGPNKQQNLRGRVASVLSFEDRKALVTEKYRHATHYSYDVTGNVPVLIQDYPDTKLGDKVIAYNFDLLSGKVNEVRYQPGMQDEFRHRYSYDDELRLTNAYTSRKGIIWEQDAEYFYYKHGLLARTELGQLKVQGLDYLYTLQGWIKGVNGTSGEIKEDAGRDGIDLENKAQSSVLVNGQTVNINVESDPNLNSSGPGYHSLHNPVAADAFGYVLSYHDGDYSPISDAQNTTTAMNTPMTGVKPLFNGNISRMYTYLQNLGGLGMNYTYDRLNRLKNQQAFSLNGATATPFDAYGMELTYDGNGNIVTLVRNGLTNSAMDYLTYNYLNTAGALIADMANPPANATNRLGFIHDHVLNSIAATNGTVKDITDQSEGNYVYDEIGNLVNDNSENINLITWNLQNKVTGIDKTDGTKIGFAYDALGNRVHKTFIAGTLTMDTDLYPNETFYVRDARGNIMATYETKNKQLFEKEQFIYGSSRLGLWRLENQIEKTSGLSEPVDWQNIKPINPAFGEDFTIRGSRQYELTNHLGNVLETISDRKLPQYNNGILKNYHADIASSQDYYPFGMEMPRRKFSSDKYKFGFNGKLNDNELKGEGNSLDFGDRIYDPRIGRWLSVDPQLFKTPYESSYSFAGNNPLYFKDLQGGSKEVSIIIHHQNGKTTTLDFTIDEDYTEKIPLVIRGIPNIPEEGTTEIYYKSFTDYNVKMVYDVYVTTNNDGIKSFKITSTKTLTAKETWFNKLLGPLEGGGGSQPGGLHLVTKARVASSTKQKSKSDPEQVDVEDLLTAFLGMGQSATADGKKFSDAVRKVAGVMKEILGSKPEKKKMMYRIYQDYNSTNTGNEIGDYQEGEKLKGHGKAHTIISWEVDEKKLKK